MAKSVFRMFDDLYNNLRSDDRLRNIVFRASEVMMILA